MAAIVIGHLPVALVVIAYAPTPNIDAWIYILISGTLHCGYQLFLMMSYRIGDLTQVYPIARGVGPILVAIVSYSLFGIALSGGQILAIMCISIGVILFGILRVWDRGLDLKPILLALVTGCFIAAYSLNDGMGARLSESALGFYGYSALVNLMIMMIFLGLWRRDILTEALINQKRMGILGGGASFIAYALVIWAFTQAPIAMVTGLREVSILFAMIIGTVFLKERLTLGKIAATGISLLGVVLMKIT